MLGFVSHGVISYVEVSLRQSRLLEESDVGENPCRVVKAGFSHKRGKEDVRHGSSDLSQMPAFNFLPAGFQDPLICACCSGLA